MSQYIPTDQLVLVPWDQVIRQLCGRGWASVPGVVHPALLVSLYQEEHWRSLSTDDLPRGEPVEVHSALTQVRPMMRDLGIRLTAALSVAAELQRLPIPPLLNEVTWGWCPPTGEEAPTGGMTPKGGFGIVALVIFAGRATVRVARFTRQAAPLQATPGQLIVIRGHGWPESTRSGVTYEVGSWDAGVVFVALSAA